MAFLIIIYSEVIQLCTLRIKRYVRQNSWTVNALALYNALNNDIPLPKLTSIIALNLYRKL